MTIHRWLLGSASCAALAAVLAGCAGEAGNRGTVAAQEAPAMSEGAREYAACAACHQPGGEGLANVAPPLAGSEWVTGRPEVAIAILLQGLEGEIEVAGTTFTGHKTPWGHLRDAQLAAVLTHVRASFGNEAPAVTAAEVAAVRQATLGRSRPWTAAELRAQRWD